MIIKFTDRQAASLVHGLNFIGGLMEEGDDPSIFKKEIKLAYEVAKLVRKNYRCLEINTEQMKILTSAVLTMESDTDHDDDDEGLSILTLTVKSIVYTVEKVVPRKDWGEGF